MKTIFYGAMAALALPAIANAHFLLEYSDQTAISAPGEVPLKLIFWHPYEAGHAMQLEAPQEFFMVHHGERSDLSASLTPFTFNGPQNSAQAFTGKVPVRRSGDYVVVTVAKPFYEESEDIYIQQIAKSVLNRNGLPTDWDAPVGLKAEIVPLNKPYNLLAGSTFTGRVLSDGAPVAGAEVEVEYIASAPQMLANGTEPATVSPPPGGAVVALTDAQGYFTFGIPRAGVWGFAALGVGPDTEYEGKELSQDAVLWVRAWDME